MVIKDKIYKEIFNKYFYLIIFFSYFFLLIIYRFVLPFGDEPDFHIRALSVVKGFQIWWTPVDFVRLDFLYNFIARGLNHLSQCNIDYNPFSLYTKIDNNLCSDTLLNNIKRIFLSLSHILIFILILFFLNYFKLLNINLNSEYKTIFLSLLLPSIIYYFNLFSHETFFYILSFLLFILIRKFIFLFILLIFFTYLDFGNSIAIYIFVFLYLTYSLLNKYVSYLFIILFLLSLLIVSLFISEFILNFIANNNLISIQQVNKFIDSTTKHNFDNSFREKYPLILRPALTYMNFLFLTPGYIKILPLYIWFSFFISYIFYKTLIILSLNKRINDPEYLELIYSSKLIIISIFTILFLTLNLPALTNAKYFLFLIPFFINHIRIIVNNNFLLYINLLLANFLVITNLIIFRIL